MPYNTRRKSLSLPSLGIQLPATSRAHNRQRSLSKSTSSSSSAQNSPASTSASKKIKRSHDPSSSSSPSSSIDFLSPEPDSSNPAASRAPPQSFKKSSKDSRAYCERTPPPSPGDCPLPNPVDTSSINDDIVVAVIEQLEKTGNRPHLIKELATALAQSNSTIANSANAAALLSSRLSLFLKRSWSATNPCPIAKELIPIHPRKVFFYLTTCPPQAVADDCDDVVAAMMQKHSAMSSSRDPSEAIDSSEEEEDNDDEQLVGAGPFGYRRRRRSQMSPSPELDLNDTIFSDQDCEACDLMPGSESHGHNLHHHNHHRHSAAHPYGVCGGHRRIVALHNSREMTPPLEGDEEEFTRTATSVRERTSNNKATADNDESAVDKTPQRNLPPSRITLDGESETQHLHSDAMEGMDWFDSSIMTDQGGVPDISFSSASSTASDIDDAQKFTTAESDDVLRTGTSVDPQATDKPAVLSQGLDTNLSEVKDKPVPSVFDSWPSNKRPISAVDVVDFETWDDLRSPETVDVDELDQYFAQYP